MGFTMDDFDRAKSKMLSDFNKAIADAEALRKAELEAFEMGIEPARAVVGEGSSADGPGPAGATGTFAMTVAGN